MDKQRAKHTCRGCCDPQEREMMAAGLSVALRETTVESVIRQVRAERDRLTTQVMMLREAIIVQAKEAAYQHGIPTTALSVEWKRFLVSEARIALAAIEAPHE